MRPEGVVLEAVACFYLFLGSLVFVGILLGFGDHALDFFGSQAAFVVGDGDGFSFAGSFVAVFAVSVVQEIEIKYLRSADFENTVCIKLERHFNLRNATRSRWDTSKLKLAEEVVHLSHGTFAFEDLNQGLQAGYRLP